MRLLLASTRNVRFDVSYSAREIPTVSLVACVAVTVSVAEREIPFSVAVMIELTGDAIEIVLTVKFTLVAPAGTVTLAGTEAIALELERVTVVGDEAAALSVTVPVDALPPATLAGFNVKPVIDGALFAGGVTVKIALCVEPP